MLTNPSTESKQKIVSRLQNENKQLNLQILAIKNERNRIRAQYEEDTKNLRTIHDYLDQTENGILHVLNDVAK